MPTGRGGKRAVALRKSPANGEQTATGSSIQKMDEARSPADENKDQFRAAIADLLIAGHSPAQIAKSVHATDKRARKNLRRRIKRMLLNDAQLSAEVGRRGKAKLTEKLGPVLDGLIAKAETGNPIAAKLVLEASGFHNPRVQHEHGGDITITMNIPRPAHRESPPAIDIPEADIVEDPPTG